MVTTRRGTSTPGASTTNSSDSNLSASPSTPTPAPRSSSKSSSSSSNNKKSLLSNGTSNGIPNGHSNSHNELNPKSEHYEFGGPIGAAFVSTTVPFFSYLLFFFCNNEVGCELLPRNYQTIWSLMVEGVKKSFLDTDAYMIYFAWYAFTVLAWAILPGKKVDGVVLRNGGKLQYPVNAFATLVVAFAATAAWIAIKGANSFTFLYDHWPGLIAASLINSFSQACLVYAMSFREGSLLALGGNSGNVLFDWFIGRELNPRIGSFDIKSFNELRPGLIFWIILDISCACHQYVSLNGRVTDSMLLVVAFHGWYVIDALYNEPAILTTMDITTDGFGFMLSVGDLTWVPFIYSLQARYLAFIPLDLGILATFGVLAVNGLGYYIFRTSNGEKNDFRNGKNPKNLTYLETSTGRKLLTSGWWGRSRHPNYFGDLVMALAWSLPTGFNTPITYFYVCYFAVLLIHRQMRDDEACREKYGKDWDKYCKIVPYKIFPYIY